MVVTDIAYNRAVPEQWPELIEYASMAVPHLDRGGDHSSAGLWEIASVVTSIDRRQLRGNYFYGMGLGICELARELADPETIESTIVTGSKTFGVTDDQGRVNDSWSLGSGFVEPIDRASTRIEPETKLVVEFLHAETVRRSKIRTQFYSGMDLDFTAIRHSQTVHAPLIKEATGAYVGSDEDQHISKQMKIAVTAATGILMSHLLFAKTGKDFAFTAPAEADINWLDNESVVRFVKRATALRVTDFRKDPSALFKLDGDLVSFVEPETDSGELHMPEGDYFDVSDVSDVCPAANINGLVPQVWGMSVELVRRAARAHHARQA